MDERNPYAPSTASLGGSASAGQGAVSGVTVWRNLNLLVMLPGSELPHRCIKCNEPADQPTKVRKVYWHPTGWYAVILVNIIIYAIVAMIVRKRALVAPGLCLAHKKRRRQWLLATYTALALGMALLWGFSSPGSAGAMAFGFLLILACPIIAFFGTRTVVARKIDENYVWLKGCGAEFLDSLPPLP